MTFFFTQTLIRGHCREISWLHFNIVVSLVIGKFENMKRGDWEWEEQLMEQSGHIHLSIKSAAMAPQNNYNSNTRDH